MKNKYIVVLTLILAYIVNSYSIDIDKEFTFITIFGGYTHDFNDPPANPFDCQVGFGYSLFFEKGYITVIGEILYSLSEMKSRRTTTIVNKTWDESNQNYQNIYGETDYKSSMTSLNVVPCLTFNNFYAGLGISAQIRHVQFPQLDSKNIISTHDDAHILLGYNWKYVQSGIYISGFVHRAGTFFKVNLLTIKKRLHSNS